MVQKTPTRKNASIKAGRVKVSHSKGVGEKKKRAVKKTEFTPLHKPKAGQ